MKKKSSIPHPSSNLPVSKQTAGGVAGAIVGGVIAGPVGAVAGAIAGTIMGNRAAKGKSLVSSGTVKGATNAVKAVKEKLPLSKSGKGTSGARQVKSARVKRTNSAAPAKKPVKAAAKVKKAARRK